MKNKKGTLTMGAIVLIFMGVIVALALFTPIIDTTAQMTQKQEVDNLTVSTVTGYLDENGVNESINYSIYTQSVWKAIDCPLESVVIRNGASTELTITTDYTLDVDNARFSLVNTTSTWPQTAINITYVDFSYCADGYNTNSGSRSILNLVLIFCALIIFAYVIEKSDIVRENFGFS